MNKKSGIGKLIFAIVLIIGILVLFACAFITQYAKYGKHLLPEVASNIKYVFLAIAVLLPVFLILFIASSFTGLRGPDISDASLLGVDFSDEVHEKAKLKSVEFSDRQEIIMKSADEAKVNADAAMGVRSTGRSVSKSEGDEEVNEGGSRFYMLTEIDKQYEDYTAPAYNNGIGLREICEIFRNYSAGTLKLYYDIEDIRRFIGALAVTKLIILQGMSGTGKTSLAYAFGEFLDNKTVVVPIQPMWKERTDLVGYYNEFTRRFNETTLLYKMYEANCNEEIYITVLDEMNIARVEYYFAEFLSLLEIPNPDGRNLDVVADRWDDDPKLLQKNGKLRLPTNMWFVGTANNDDSTFSISDKVYDRAMVLNLDKKAIPFDAPATESMKLSATHLEELFKRAQREYDLSDRNLRRIKKLDEYMIQTFHITFGNRIMKQI
ncbi:MAG: AAA family ATPase, partial [Clostridia bacterium]|nr:AAA family ATPase [Clostridia bacterium]